jgi:hypothetical protein
MCATRKPEEIPVAERINIPGPSPSDIERLEIIADEDLGDTFMQAPNEWPDPPDESELKSK